MKKRQWCGTRKRPPKVTVTHAQYNPAVCCNRGIGMTGVNEEAAAKAEAIGEHELRLLRRYRGAFGILDHRRRRERRVLAARGERYGFFGAEPPRVE